MQEYKKVKWWLANRVQSENNRDATRKRYFALSLASKDSSLSLWKYTQSQIFNQNIVKEPHNRHPTNIGSNSMG